jgi:uncharacterized zinc-type alcohol dehydrogenase-like protein
MEAQNKQPTRRAFIQTATLAGAGLLMANPMQLFSQANKNIFMGTTVKSKGYANR